MNVFQKYSRGFNDDPVRLAALRAFSAVVDGREGRMTFKMATDEQMRDILDDEDYNLWVDLKHKDELMMA